MKIIQTKKGVKITLFNSSKELTAERNNELNKLALLDMTVGDSMETVGVHFSKLHELLSQNENEAARKEAVNLHNNFYFMLEGINLTCLSFAMYVKQIASEICDDLTEEGAKRTVEKLYKTGITEGEVEEQLDDLKKKLLMTFNPSFLIDSDKTTTQIQLSS